MPIHNQSALRSGTNLKRILISNRYFRDNAIETVNRWTVLNMIS